MIAFSNNDFSSSVELVFDSATPGGFECLSYQIRAKGAQKFDVAPCCRKAGCFLRITVVPVLLLNSLLVQTDHVLCGSRRFQLDTLQTRDQDEAVLLGTATSTCAN